MGWSGVGAESIDLSEYPCEYARTLPTIIIHFLWGGTYPGLLPLRQNP